MAPCKLADVEKVDLHVLSIDPGIGPRLKARLEAGETITQDAARSVVRDIYRRYIHHWSGNFRSLFEHLVDEGAPLVFHCSAGKDRTGRRWACRAM